MLMLLQALECAVVVRGAFPTIRAAMIEVFMDRPLMQNAAMLLGPHVRI